MAITIPHGSANIACSYSEILFLIYILLRRQKHISLLLWKVNDPENFFSIFRAEQLAEKHHKKHYANKKQIHRKKNMEIWVFKNTQLTVIANE